MTTKLYIEAQRITNASGVGLLEHLKWVDRRTLGELDDCALPTVFGTTCPLEICFPAEEVITAFAQLSASRLLLEFEHYQPPLFRTSATEEQQWLTKWRDFLECEISDNHLMSITLPTFQREKFRHANQAQLDDLWGQLQRFSKANRPFVPGPKLGICFVGISYLPMCVYTLYFRSAAEMVSAIGI